jgi:hypothetical protein
MRSSFTDPSADLASSPFRPPNDLAFSRETRLDDASIGVVFARLVGCNALLAGVVRACSVARGRCAGMPISMQFGEFNPELLLAAQVALRCLDGNVAEQKLDLIELAAG